MSAKPAVASSEPVLPADLRKALAAAPAAKARWSDLTTIARMDFIRWIGGAKQPETRRRRIERTCSMLVEGKRRPCCYAAVPLDLHKALAAAPKSKAHWSGLSSVERRKLIGWVEQAEERDARKKRIERACAALAAGKLRSLT